MIQRFRLSRGGLFALLLGMLGLASAAEYAPSDITKVAMLGTSTPDPVPDRAGPAIAIVVNDTPYLFDAGTGVVRQAMTLTPKFGGPIAGLDQTNLNRVFLTHLHSDHTLGLADLMNTPWTYGRKSPLHVHGPEGTGELVKHLLMAYRVDRSLRIYGGQPANNTGWRTIAHEFTEGGLVYEDDNISVKAIATKHGSWPLAVAYAIQTPDRKIVISGDTALSEDILKASRGADILLHEVYGLENFGYGIPMMKAEPDRWMKYMSEFHTSTKQVAELANAAKPGLLVLYHQVIWSDDQEASANEVRALYKGRVISANDLDVY